MGTGEDDWDRLADRVVRRRVQLGFPRRVEFVRAKDINESRRRILAALENRERRNFTREMLIYFEHLLEWSAGSVDAVLRGGEPTPLEESEHDIRISYEVPPLPALRLELHRLVDLVPDGDLARIRAVLAAIIEQP